jgi:uncharacterized membrane protein YqjE
MDPARPLAPAPPRTTPMDVVRLLHAGGGALVAQALLHGELAHVEWQEEKTRLLRMLAVTLLGFAGLLCALLFAGGLVVAAAWDTAYRLPALASLVLLSAAGTAAAWRRFQAMAELGEQAFAASREELAADTALLKRNL